MEVLQRRAGQADADNLEKQRQRIRREREKVVRRLTSTKVVRYSSPRSPFSLTAIIQQWSKAETGKKGAEEKKLALPWSRFSDLHHKRSRG